jgi:hypothetical protein
MKDKGILAAIVAVCALVAIASAASAKRPTLVPYTIVFKVVDYDHRGVGTEAYSEIKYVSSRGLWRKIKSLPGGANVEQFAQVGRGVFSIDRAKRKMFFESPYAFGTTEPSQRNKAYVRSENVLGFSTNVLRSGTPESYIETFLAPELNDDIIKIVIKRPTGKRIIEPVIINRGEPPRRALARAEYEVDYSRDKRRRVR